MVSYQWARVMLAKPGSLAARIRLLEADVAYWCRMNTYCTETLDGDVVLDKLMETEDELQSLIVLNKVTCARDVYQLGADWVNVPSPIDIVSIEDDIGAPFL